MRNIYRVDTTDCPTMDMVLVETTNDGKFIEGYVLTLDYKDRVEVRQATYTVGDSQLTLLTPDQSGRIDEANEKLAGLAGGNALGEPIAVAEQRLGEVTRG